LFRRVDPKVIDGQIAELVDHAEARTTKEWLSQQGFFEATSLYGVVHHAGSAKRVYRRIEIWANEALDEKRILMLHDGFTKTPPIFVYTIWSLDVKTDELRMEGGWERDVDEEELQKLGGAEPGKT